MPAYVEETAPAIEEQLRELRALPRPDDERIDEYIGKVEQILASARELAAAAERGLADEARRVGRRTERLTREARALARALGAEECARQ